MILEQRRLLITKALCDILALLLRQHYTVEAIIHDMVVMESTCILSQTVNLAAERTPRPSVD